MLHDDAVHIIAVNGNQIRWHFQPRQVLSNVLPNASDRHANLADIRITRNDLLIRNAEDIHVHAANDCYVWFLAHRMTPLSFLNIRLID